MDNLDKVADKLINIIQKDLKKKTSGYDTVGIVRRIENGVVWVHFDNGIDETPAVKSIDCRVGDKVRVRISNGKAFLVGNETAPPTDDAKAITAETKAVIAQETATSSMTLAEQAESEADRAKAAADDASRYAISAEGSANSALSSANTALLGLSEVEDVLGTLNWVTEHGAYPHTKDLNIIPNKVYYEVENAVYTQTQDQSIVANKDYYTESGGVYTWVSTPDVSDIGSYYELVSGEYAQVIEPTVDNIGSYYELKIDEALSNYVATHLALTDTSLWVKSDNISTSLQLSSEDGLVIWGENGPVATYGESVLIGDANGFHITIDTNNGIIFWQDADTQVASINSNIMTIPNALMMETITVGDWEWRKQSSRNLTLTWAGGTN